MECESLYLQDAAKIGERTRILVVGEVLWDIFPDSTRLGGAPLNFAAHATRLGHDTVLISAVGNDDLGREARKRVGMFGIDTKLLGTSHCFGTGTARVTLEPEGRTSFAIPRPAAYDDVSLSAGQIRALQAWNPGWLYCGTLFAVTEQGRATLSRVFEAFPEALRFYDVNLRPGLYNPSLVKYLLAQANVVKLSDDELPAVQEMLGLHCTRTDFCVAGTERFGWAAVSVTLGSRGCAVYAGGEYAECAGLPIQAADPVGAGDAFAAAFVHGLTRGWSAPQLASFANRIGALVASRPGAIPDWTLAEAASLKT